MIADGREKVAWGMVRRIFATWVVTVPFAGGFAAIATLALRAFIKV